VAEYEGSAAMDALMAAITDEPGPEGARDDAEFMAEHRSALADVALLREQLAVIGDALADDKKATEPARPVRRPRRSGNRRPAGAPKKRSRHPGALAVSLGVLAVAVVASMVVGMSWLLAQGGGMSGSSDSAAKADSDNKGASSSLSAPGYIACSRLIVEGKVARVEQVPGATQDRITLDVDRYYKPAKGADHITFLMAQDADPRLHRGDHVLVAIRSHAATPDKWTTGEAAIARERAWILKALPQSQGVRCE
jgi:hypothetical protein